MKKNEPRRSAGILLVVFIIFVECVQIPNAWATAPQEFAGIWKLARPSSLLKTDDGGLPPLLSSAQQIYKQNLKARKNGDTTFDGTGKCLPPGIPRLLLMSKFQLVPAKDLLGIFYEWNHTVRFIYFENLHETNSMGYTLYLGNSIGRWDTDGFVVDTIESDESTLLDSAMPHSSALHLTERYLLADKGKTLLVRVTIDDAGTFSHPWSTTLRFSRQAANMEIKEDVCTDRLGLIPSITGAVPKKGLTNSP